MKDGDAFLEKIRKRNDALKILYIFTLPDEIQMPAYTEYLKEHKN